MELGTLSERIETMKFLLGMKPCECQKWIDKNKFLYIESVPERALF
jgi:hypothetical protein